MSLIICLLLLCPTLPPKVLEISPAESPVLPVAGPLDATFTHDGRLTVLSDGITLTQRYLSLWSTRESKWLLSKAIGFETLSKKGRWTDCSRTAYFASSNSIVVCGSATKLLVLDGDSFDAKREINLDKWTNTYDFVVNEKGHRIYVVGLTRGKGVSLTEYGFDTGNLIRQTLLSDLDDCYPISIDSSLATSNSTIAVYGPAGGSSRGAIAICQEQSTVSCKTTQLRKPVGKLAFKNDDEALFVSSPFADHGSSSRHDCINSISTATLAVDQHAYCADTGAHYALALIQARFLLAYSGYATFNPITETTRNVTDAISVWDSESRHIVAVGKFTGTQASQTGMRIIASTAGEKQFLVFNTFGADILLFDLTALTPG